MIPCPKEVAVQWKVYDKRPCIGSSRVNQLPKGQDQPEEGIVTAREGLVACHRTLLHLDPILGLCIDSELIKHFLVFVHVYHLSFHRAAFGPLHPVLRTNIHRPCPLDTKMGTLILGFSSLEAQTVAWAFL